MGSVNTSSSCSSRLGLRATPEQDAVLRRAAEVAHKSLTDFVLDAACRAAEQTLLDLLEQPERDNAGLADLFAHRAPWPKT